MDQETLETRLKQESKPKGSSADPKPASGSRAGTLLQRSEEGPEQEADPHSITPRLSCIHSQAYHQSKHISPGTQALDLLPCTVDTSSGPDPSPLPPAG